MTPTYLYHRVDPSDIHLRRGDRWTPHELRKAFYLCASSLTTLITITSRSSPLTSPQQETEVTCSSIPIIPPDPFLGEIVFSLFFKPSSSTFFFSCHLSPSSALLTLTLPLPVLLPATLPSLAHMGRPPLASIIPSSMHIKVGPD